MTKQSGLIDSASILVIRDNEKSKRLEILMVRRHQDINFAGGAYVFPGGKVDEEDLSKNISLPLFPPDYNQFIATAIREVYEESGLVIGNTTGKIEAASTLSEREQQLSSIFQSLEIDTLSEYIAPFARWITPRAYTKRFDTRFFLARAPRDQKAVPDNHEIVEAVWVEPADFIEKNREHMMFPTIMNLKLLSQASSVDEAMEQARNRKIIPVEPRLVDGIRVIDPSAGYGEIDQGNIHPGEKNNPL